MVLRTQKKNNHVLKVGRLLYFFSTRKKNILGGIMSMAFKLMILQVFEKSSERIVKGCFAVEVKLEP